MRFRDADVAVVGQGPAGRALAHRLLMHGARVVVVDPAPARHWWQTYAGWRRQLPGWLDDAVVGSACGRPVIRAPHEMVLADEYVVLDNGRLQEQLSLTGARRVAEVVRDEDLAGLAPVVVDARGSHPLGSVTGGRYRQGVPVQSAHGVVLEGSLAADLLDRAPAVLMDWRPDDGSRSWSGRRPSFCYVLPLADGRVLVEETSLAATPAMGQAVLRSRLATRLRRHGVPAHVMASAPVERVHIPLLAAPRSVSDARKGQALVHRFGAAGDELNPISGYSVLASLARADEFAQELLDGEPTRHRRGPDPRRAALAALDRLDGDATMRLFDAFAHLPAQAQRAVLDPDTGTTEVLRAMARQWWTMSAHRSSLARATAAGVAGLLPAPRLTRPGQRR